MYQMTKMVTFGGHFHQLKPIWWQKLEQYSKYHVKNQLQYSQVTWTLLFSLSHSTGRTNKNHLRSYTRFPVHRKVVKSKEFNTNVEKNVNLRNGAKHIHWLLETTNRKSYTAYQTSVW